MESFSFDGRIGMIFLGNSNSKFLFLKFKLHVLSCHIILYINHGNFAKKGESQAMDFIKKLGKSRYITFVLDILNNITKNSMIKPVNINKVYNLETMLLEAKPRQNKVRYAVLYATIYIP